VELQKEVKGNILFLKLRKIMFIHFLATLLTLKSSAPKFHYKMSKCIFFPEKIMTSLKYRTILTA